MTVADIRRTGNAAIRQHHEEAAEYLQLKADLASVAGEPWAKHIWHLDPRFASSLLPRGDATVYDIATTGSLGDKRVLWGNSGCPPRSHRCPGRPHPRGRRRRVRCSDQRPGRRHDWRRCLPRTGLGGQDPITNRQMARRLGVSDQRASQIVQRLCVSPGPMQATGRNLDAPSRRRRAVRATGRVH